MAPNIPQPDTTQSLLNRSDAALLQSYVTGEQAGFAQLVTRHINSVYSAARRQVRDEHLAQDVTQAVFLVLSQKAASIKECCILPAWLHRTTQYCAANAIRMQTNRQRHEWRAAAMRSNQLEDESGSSNSTESSCLGEAIERLDAAVNRLPELERKAIILRYFQGMENAQVGSDLGISPAAAAKRIQRGVTKLRGILAKSGPITTVAALSASLSKAPAHAAPPLLAQSVCRGIATTSAMPAGLASIANGALRMMLWAQIRALAAVMGCAAVLFAGMAAALLAATRADGADKNSSPTTAPAQQMGSAQLTATTQPAIQPAWRAEFDAAYRRGDGDAVARVMPPCVNARNGFLKDY